LVSELLRGLFERVGFVGDFPSDILVVDLAEAPVVGDLRVDRAQAVELFDDVRRLEMKRP
jgi:hypothetical protein